MSLQLLTVGHNPNLLFYAWRLQQTRSCSVTVVDDSINPTAPITWKSKPFGEDVFTPNRLVPSVSHLDRLAKFDFIILSVSNLQMFQDVCALLGPHVKPDTLVVTESTGYVNLEPFVALGFPKYKDMTVCSIMNESDIKRHPDLSENVFYHRLLSSDLRIYIGSSSVPKNMTAARDSQSFSAFYSIWQAAQEASKGVISLLKSTNPKEFTTYQWKHALPRIVLNPLSVLFEESLPQDLSRQILAKPLITGLVNEVFKIIKKMECKLVKGFENEANLVKNWLSYFPLTTDDDSPAYVNANSLIYNFYHQQDIEVDLLLLQPILLGDDHAVKTPYLENVYSIMCQLMRINSPQGSVFFTRKNSGYDSKKNEYDILTQEMARLNMEKLSLDSTFHERLVTLQQLENAIAQKSQILESLLADHDSRSRELLSAQGNHQRRMADLDEQYKQKQAELHALTLQINNHSAALSQHQAQDQPQAAETKNLQTPQQANLGGTPDLSDFADVAMYAAQLNGEHEEPQQYEKLVPQDQQQQQQPQQPPQQQQQQQQQQPPQPQGYDQGYQNYDNYSNGHSNGYYQNGNEEYHGANGVNKSVPMNSQMNGSVNSQMNGGYSNNGFYQGPSNNMPGAFPPNGPNGPMQYGSLGSVPQIHPGGPHQNHMQQMPQQQMPQYQRAHSNMTLGRVPPQMNGQYDEYVDQMPPHGLPPNGFPQNTLPSTLRNPQRYQQQGPAPPMGPGGPVPNGGYQHPMARHRVSSFPTSMNSFGDQPAAVNQQGYAPQMQQMPMAAPSMLGGAPMAGGMRKPNRRSAMPRMTEEALHIDYGGRGGMPMSGASTAPPPTKAKHRSMMPGGPTSSPPLHQGPHLGSQSRMGTASQLNVNDNSDSSHSGDHTHLSAQLQQPQSHKGHLRLPEGASNLGSVSSAAEDPSAQQDIRINVPQVEAKAPEEMKDKKKKKKGFFKRSHD